MSHLAKIRAILQGIYFPHAKHNPQNEMSLSLTLHQSDLADMNHDEMYLNQYHLQEG